MGKSKLEILERALYRERAARKQAERILEDKSAELYLLSQELSKTNLKLEKSIEEKTSELKGVFENIIDAYVVMDVKGFVLKMNEPANVLLGYDSKTEKINLFDLVHPEDQEKVNVSFVKLMTDGILTDFQVRIVTKTSQIKTVQINSSVIYDQNNMPIAAQGIVRDITKIKEAEELLIASEHRLATLILNLDSGILLEDENRKIVLTNNKFCELFSIPVAPKELIGLDCSESAETNKVFFEEPESFVANINKIIKNKETILGEDLKMVDGRILERSYVPIFNKKAYKGHLWSYRDVTLERKYHQNIEAEKLKYSNIIANMNLGLLEVGLEDEILMINQSFSEMSGYSEEELLGEKAKKVFLDSKQLTVNREETSKRLKGISNSYELEIKSKDGKKHIWLISGGPNYNINGKVVGSIGIHLDITDLKNLERQKEVLLSKLERSNDELEEYAHIVSHDLKSPLRSINALVHWLKEDNIGLFDEASLHNFSLVEATLEKMEKLISDILDYSSITSEVKELKPVDLNVVINDLKDILYIPEHISLNILRKLPIINGDATKFQQLFQNMIGNAIRYIDKEKGLIEVGVVEHTSYYEFSIKDNGIGIEKKHHDKIFKIFQSLNTDKESTGVGLSIVKKIIDVYKGEIWLESTVGKGTTFYFTLIK